MAYVSEPCGSWTSVTLPYVVTHDAPWVSSSSAGCCGEEFDFAPVLVATAESTELPGVESVVDRPIEPQVPVEVAAVEPSAPPESVIAALPAAERPLTIPEGGAATSDEPQFPELRPAPQLEAAAVKPASNDEPSLEPVPATPDRGAEPSIAPQPAEAPVAPKEENLFEKVERRAGEPVGEPSSPVEPAADVSGGTAVLPASGDVPSAPPVAESVEPAGEASPVPSGGLPPEPAEPATESKEPADPATESAAEPAAESAAAREPLRRWIDVSGSYAVVGELVAVGGDRVSIRRNDGREISVPLEKLSDHDRAYARGAGERLAAKRQAAPASGDTAGL